jgi:hypothetical protein
LAAPTFLKDIVIMQRVVAEAYETGFVNAIEEVHDRLLELERDDFGKVTMIDVLDIVDSFIKKEVIQ